MRINAVNTVNMNRAYSSNMTNRLNVSFKSNQKNEVAIPAQAPDSTQFKSVKAKDSLVSKLVKNVKSFFKSSDSNNQFQSDLDQYVAERVYLI